MRKDEVDLYRLHSRLPVFRRRLEKTREIIHDSMPQIERPYVSVSFGKDSMVLMHLLIQAVPDIPVVWSDRGEEAELPATYPLVDEVVRRYGINLQIIKPSMTMFEIYCRYGLPEIDDGASRIIVKEINLVMAFAEYARQNKNDGYFQGLRASESRGRMMMANSYGPIHHRKKDGMIVCNPLLRWTARDIWAYTVVNGLPYHPEYDNDKFKSREDIRLSNWSGLYMSRKGRMAELKYYYPDLFQRLVAEFPEVRSLV